MLGKRELDRIIEKSEPGTRVFCRIFEDALWRDRDRVLVDLGFEPIPRHGLFELPRSEASRHLAYAMAYDLCYSGRVASLSRMAAIADEFLSRHHWQSRHFTNAKVPMTAPGFVGEFSPLFARSTIDTGVLIRTGDHFSGLLWVFSWD